MDKELMIWQQKNDIRRQELEDLESESNIVDKTKLKEDIENVDFFLFSHPILFYGA